MAYIDVEDLRAYLGIEKTGDDALLVSAIDDAQSYIEEQTDRVFEATASTARYYRADALDPFDGSELHLDEDLLTCTELLNGDSSNTEITAASYWLEPANDGPPYHKIKLYSTTSWEWDTDERVSVTGTWGFSTTPPGDIKRACTVLAAFFYKQKDAQVFDTTAIPEAGVITIPQGIPVTVMKIIKKYKRHF